MGNCAYHFSRFIVDARYLYVKEVSTITSPRFMLQAQPICRYSETCECTPRITAGLEVAALVCLRQSLICTPPTLCQYSTACLFASRLMRSKATGQGVQNDRQRSTWCWHPCSACCPTSTTELQTDVCADMLACLAADDQMLTGRRQSSRATPTASGARQLSTAHDTLCTDL